MSEKPYDNPITDYWLEHYVNKGMCSLCGNHGVIDSRGVKTPAGLEVGCLNYCICPNGQAMRAHSSSPETRAPRAPRRVYFL